MNQSNNKTGHISYYIRTIQRQTKNIITVQKT